MYVAYVIFVLFVKKTMILFSSNNLPIIKQKKSVDAIAANCDPINLA